MFSLISHGSNMFQYLANERAKIVLLFTTSRRKSSLIKYTATANHEVRYISYQASFRGNVEEKGVPLI